MTDKTILALLSFGAAAVLAVGIMVGVNDIEPIDETETVVTDESVTQETMSGGAGRYSYPRDTTTQEEPLNRVTEDTESDVGVWDAPLPIVETETEAVEVVSEDAILIAKTIGIEAPHCSTMEQAAIAWTILNRVDDERFPATIAKVVTAPMQFAYFESTPVRDDLYDLALDVLARWERERDGETDVGRILPREYVYYDGDLIAHNYFRAVERVGAPWDWSLPDPYA